MIHATERITPKTGGWGWQSRGSCRESPSSLFFDSDGERGLARDAQIRQAKLVCQRCPVIAECRSHALTAREPFGIWGGMTEMERRGHYERPQNRQRRRSPAKPIDNEALSQQEHR